MSEPTFADYFLICWKVFTVFFFGGIGVVIGVMAVVVPLALGAKILVRLQEWISDR